MSQARVWPVIGGLLGALLGIVTAAVLAVAGVIAPDRLPLLGSVGVGTIVGAALLTQRITLAKKRLVGALVAGALLIGVALTGIPEMVRGGAVSAGCMVTGTSSLEPNPVTPANTTLVNGFSMTPTDTVAWTTQTAVPVPEATARVAMQVGGFSIPLRTYHFAEAPEVTTWEGSQAVAPQLAAIQDASGFFVTGIYQVSAHVEAESGECTANAYVNVVPDGPFATSLLKTLWTVGGVVVIALVVLTVVVRRSIRESDRSLTMVGLSALPGETFTTVPVSPTSPAKTPPVSEPSQPTVPEPSGEGGSSTESQSRIGEEKSAGEAKGATDSEPDSEPGGEPDSDADLRTPEV